MKKKLGLFVIVGIMMSAGVASADRGFWFSDVANSWATFFNIMNVGASQTVTVEFFDEAGVSLGSTSTTLGTNAQWNFNTGTVGNITASTLEAGTRGVALITGATAGEMRGHVSIFNSSSSSGFQMRIPTIANSDTAVQ
ncbi:MAG: hypothetical protein ACE5EN_08785 [Nitrospinota bacterium]